MDDLGDLLQGGVTLQTEPLEHGLEGAVLAVMRQVDTEHVEADAAFGVSAFSYKKEAAASETYK